MPRTYFGSLLTFVLSTYYTSTPKNTREFCEHQSASVGRRMIRISRRVHALACLDLSSVYTSKRDIGVGVGVFKTESRADVPQLTPLGGLGRLRLDGRHQAGRRGLPAAVALLVAGVVVGVDIPEVQGRISGRTRAAAQKALAWSRRRGWGSRRSRSSGWRPVGRTRCSHTSRHSSSCAWETSGRRRGVPCGSYRPPPCGGAGWLHRRPCAVAAHAP